MKIKTEQVKLEELSSIEYEVHIGNSNTVDYLEIMILKFRGTYGFGSDGNSDAAYMSAIGKAVLEAWEPGGLVIDLSELTYEWGDRLEYVFSIGSDKYSDTPFPVSLIVGKKSEEAIRKLLLGIDSNESIENTGWVFRDLDHAWNYVECKLLEYKTRQLI